MRRHLIAAALVVLCGGIVNAQVPLFKMSLSERIQHRPDPTAPYSELRLEDDMAFGMETSLQTADRVVYGRVAEIKTGLDPTGKDLLTDYTVTPIRTLWPRSEAGGSVPGVVTSLVVTRWGGQATIDGVQVKQSEQYYPPFHIGEELVLCLQRNPKTDKYTIVHGMAIFAVEDGNIRPWTTRESDYREYRGMPLTLLESKVQALRSGGQ